MEQISAGKNDLPRVSVTISDCGIMNDVNEKDEIDLDGKQQAVEQSNDKNEGVVDEEIELPDDEEIELREDEEEDDDGTPKTKSQLLKERLRKLKMKTNQARHLNRQEVLREGERLGSAEGITKDRKRQAMHDKKLRQQEWQAHNAKALSIAAENGVDGKAMVEPAVESVRKTFSKQQKAESRRYGVNDYYNPEGQHRNYERNVKSVPTGASLQNATSTFDPTITSTQDDAHEREGARRLANELKRRIEKKAKRKQDEFEASDVGYINKRNKRFNEKISRTYDSHSAEIKKSLERGTAL